MMSDAMRYVEGEGAREQGAPTGRRGLEWDGMVRSALIW
jgi:hypothetical protein